MIDLMPKLKRRDELTKLFYAVHKEEMLPIDAITQIEQIIKQELESLRVEKREGIKDYVCKLCSGYEECDCSGWNECAEEVNRKVDEKVKGL